jgi:hypothetical protein
MLMNKTILRIKERDGQLFRTWEGSFGPAATIDLMFVDGSEGSVNTKPEYAEKHVKALMAIVGQPGEFDVEEKPEYNGIPQFKVKEYPGKPTGQGQFGGGGGGGGGRGGGDWETHDERAFRTASIVAQVAAKLVAQHGGAIGAADFEDNVTRVARSIASATEAVRAEQKYPAKTAPAPAAPAAPAATGGPGPRASAPAVPMHAPIGQVVETVTASELNGGTPAPVHDADWDDAMSAALQNWGSNVRLQIFLKKSPEEATVAELIEAALAPATAVPE